MQVLNQVKVDRILKSGNIKLNLGSGHHNYPDYICIDLNPEVTTGLDIQGDIMDLSMFASGTVDEIVCYHVIEHLGHRNVPRFFQECYRVLKEHGEFIFECPDLGECIEQFSKIKHNSGEIKGDLGDGSIYETIYGGQKDPGSFHLGCFTKWQLMVMLKYAGWEEPNIIPELPRRGPEYGIKWNIRFRCVK
jgi:predicted SAM-dependent methyltransferase